MKMRFSTAIFVAACSLSFARAQSPDAIVVSVSGRALVKDAQKAKPRPLRKQDGLFAKQWVNCGSGCKELTISYCNVRVPVTRNSGWKQIYSVYCGSLQGKRGGASKGEDISIISPKEFVLTQPEAFSLKWKPYRHPTTVYLTLGVYLGEKIWGPKRVDGRKGVFESSSLKAALKRAQKAGEVHLFLTFDDGNETTQKVKFDLTSLENQQVLNGKLRAFEKETDRIVKALGRGTTFSEYELYDEAVKELEEALRISQERKVDQSTQIELRRLAIMANYKAYNDERVKQLCKLSKLSMSTPSDACAKIFE